MAAGMQGTRGRDAFPPEVADLFARDPHRPGSVDAVLLDHMVPVTYATAHEWYRRPAAVVYRGGRPRLEAHARAALGDAFHEVQKAAALLRFCHRIPPLPAGESTRDVASEAPVLLGGTEEEIIADGVPFAAERARTLCAMAQIAGIPARIVFLAREQPAERHAVTELYVHGRWGVWDAFSGRFYQWPKHGYASAWDIHQIPRIADEKPDHGRDRYVESAFYRFVAIVDYDVNNAGAYAYPRDPVPPDLAARLRDGRGS